jgi:glucokinase
MSHNNVECLAVDIGATKIDLAIVASTGEIRNRVRVHVADHADLATALVTAGAPLAREVGVVGVGTCGPFGDDGDTVSPLNIPAWRSYPLRQILSDEWRLPVTVDLDTKALARAEGYFGAARGCANYLSMVVSSGVGGGVVSDGRVLEGEARNAGHIGHLCVNPEGHLCACGARGCLEAEIGGLALTGRGINPENASLEIREECATHLGQALASVAVLMDCTTTYVGGAIALGWGDDFLQRAQRHARRLAGFSYSDKITVSLSGLGDTGGLLGAALVGWGA